MTQTFRTVLSFALGLLVTVSLAAQAQTPPPRFLTLTPPTGLPVIPVMEGWIANPDGTRTIVFGYINRNDDDIQVPVGENNYIEPAEFNGLQTDFFASGRGAQVFTVTLPADRIDEDVWWYITSGDNETLKVPGRAGTGAYELEFMRPRPQGALQPHIGIGDNGATVPGLISTVAEFPDTVRAGEEVELTVNAVDPSERDPTDPRFEEPLDMGVRWYKHQGPGEVTFSRHPSTPEPENPYDEDDPRFGRWRAGDPSEGVIEGGSGVARVIASFSAPGEYLIRTHVDNFTAPDSSQGDQCCQSSVLQRVTVR